MVGSMVPPRKTLTLEGSRVYNQNAASYTLLVRLSAECCGEWLAQSAVTVRGVGTW